MCPDKHVQKELQQKHFWNSFSATGMQLLFTYFAKLVKYNAVLIQALVLEVCYDIAYYISMKYR